MAGVQTEGAGSPDRAAVGAVKPPPLTPPRAPEGVMSLTEHLSELRSRLIKSIAAIGAGMVLGFLISEPVIAFLATPVPAEYLPLRVPSVGDPLAIRLRIAFVAGVILAMPVLLWQLWGFIAPGLTENERRIVRPWIPLALTFFALGVAIAWIVLPYAVTFLLSFTTPDLEPLLIAREYFDFVSTMFLAFGLLLEFPIVLYALSLVGIVSSEFLRRSRRYAILIIAIFAAVATPGGDIVSPLILGVTMYVLFEGTVQVIRRRGR
jgi:sec-independent protein translocase protein TatC